MSSSNYEKMMRVIDQAFATRQHPDQLQMNAAQRKKLALLHPATMLEQANDSGPLVWVLLIPTTTLVMQKFVTGEISEKELLDLTEPGQKYEAVYLCSATTLPEARKKGLTRKVCLQGIKSIRNDHPIRALFVWPFSEGGIKLAESVARDSGLPLFVRPHKPD